NNIFVNTAGGRALTVSTLPSLLTSSDHNNFYTTGANFTYVNNTAQTDLSGWQAATGFDMNSLSVDPVFFGTKDLHVTNIALDSAGTPVAGITDDIEIGRAH